MPEERVSVQKYDRVDCAVVFVQLGSAAHRPKKILGEIPAPTSARFPWHVFFGSVETGAFARGENYLVAILAS
jgi:hypothetical protein